MKIVIFGASGMLGSQLRKVFAELSPYSFDKKDVDVTNVDAVSAIMTQLEPDVVINTASYTGVDEAEKDPVSARKVNAEGVKNIAVCAKENGSIMVHYSTDYIFDGSNKSGYNEDYLPRASEPLNVYGRTKLEGENILRRTHAKHYIIRTSWLFGPKPGDFVDAVIAQAKKNKELRIVDDQFSKPTYVKDLAQATRVLLSEAGEELRFGTYHITNENVATRLDLAKKAIELFGAKHGWEESDFPKIKGVSSEEFSALAKRPKHSALNNNKFIKMRPWEEALEEYIIKPPAKKTNLA